MKTPDLVLLPHCDLHVALHGAAPLTLRVIFRQDNFTPNLSYRVDDVTEQCIFEFFAPHQLPGHRFDALPTVNLAPGLPIGLVTATTPGIYLLQVRFGTAYQVARLQVHDRLIGWWFGNSSLTVAADPEFAHGQPSIYASFSSDPSGADTVGDITGHGYVTLTAPAGPVVVAATAPVPGTLPPPDGRLRGTAPGASIVTGSLGPISLPLPVTVVDYGLVRDELDVVRVRNLATPADAHNMVFIGEGFRADAADRALFEQIVTKAVDDLFSKPRHQPYGLLEKSFNVWKTYAPSLQHGLTCGFGVNEAGASATGGPAPGTPIPYEESTSADGSKYTVRALVARVGLPRSNEARDLGALIAEWNGQSLNDFDPTKVDQRLVDAWKTQKLTGILEARDTFFGFRLGSRPGDRVSGSSIPIVTPPPRDDVAEEALKPFIKRVYEFFSMISARLVLLDPRRHAIEVLGHPSADANPGAPVMRYLSNLRWRKAPHPPVGQEWRPDPAQVTFKRSVGLVGIIVNEELYGGANICAGSMTATAFGTLGTVEFDLAVDPAKRTMRRKMPPAFAATVDAIIDTVAHEFGHSFNLHDEYEEIAGLDPNATTQTDYPSDNVSHLGALFLHGTINPDGSVHLADDQIDPARVKWFDLLRMKVSSPLIANATASGGGMLLTIDPGQAAAWVEAKKKNLLAFLRARNFPASGRQLPLSGAAADVQVNLTLGAIDEAKGTIVVTGAALPPGASPVFQAGALLFIPRRAADAAPARVVEQKVFQKLATTHNPLNKVADNTIVNRGEDVPVDIDGFKPPCKSYKVIGLYEGAIHQSGRAYRPAGLCKMRTQSDGDDGDSAFCHVCKWLIVNRVDASLHAILDDRFYPTSRKGGDG